MPRTLFEKIWDVHVVAEVEGGRALLYIDRPAFRRSAGRVSPGRMHYAPTSTLAQQRNGPDAESHYLLL